LAAEAVGRVLARSRDPVAPLDAVVGLEGVLAERVVAEGVVTGERVVAEGPVAEGPVAVRRGVPGRSADLGVDRGADEALEVPAGPLAGLPVGEVQVVVDDAGLHTGLR